MRRLILLVAFLVAAAVGLLWAGERDLGPVVITREGEQKLVLMFGNPRSVLMEPGLSFRLPFVTNVRTFDKRLLYLNTEALPVLTRDDERVIVDNYVAWRIREPLLFYESFPVGMSQAELQIDRVVRADLRNQIGQRTLTEVVTDARAEIMEATTSASRDELAAYGIEVRDVRINRTELPPETEKKVYDRMRSDRQALAAKYRAEGQELAEGIRAEADRRAEVIRAEGRKQSSILRGEGDAKAARIYASAHNSAPEFYGFTRRLEAYRKSIGKHTTLVLPPDNEFFELFASPDARRR